ncbi:unnamed protein product [Amoebophrya sp. A25]|nr:unnamed protein product [Amoebophrya sp. A25]|eukprot:GSA25T00023650001.1
MMQRVENFGCLQIPSKEERRVGYRRKNKRHSMSPHRSGEIPQSPACLSMADRLILPNSEEQSFGRSRVPSESICTSPDIAAGKPLFGRLLSFRSSCCSSSKSYFRFCRKTPSIFAQHLLTFVYTLLLSGVQPVPVLASEVQLSPSCYINWEVPDCQETDACACIWYIRILNEAAFYFVLFIMTKWMLLGTQ